MILNDILKRQEEKTKAYYIEFLQPGNSVLCRMKELFSYLAGRKRGPLPIEGLEYEILNDWKNYFSEEELNRFWWPTEQEAHTFWKQYQELPSEERNDFLNTVPWDFESMFDEIGQGEYGIEGIMETAPDTYRLYFNPISYPFGGIEPLIALIKIYGARILEVNA